jgi:hypothetical protein
MRTLAYFVFLLSPIISANAQESTTREPEAVLAIEQALAAAGGPAWRLIQDIRIEGEASLMRGPKQESNKFVFLLTREDFRYETTGPEGTTVIVSGRGKPHVIHPDGTVTRLGSHEAETDVPGHAVALALLKLSNDTGYELTAEQGDSSFKMVSAGRKTGTFRDDLSLQKWFFDRALGLPIRVDYRAPSHVNRRDWVEVSDRFSDYRVVQGIAVPFRVDSYVNGQPVAVSLVTSVQLNSGATSDRFTGVLGGAQ